jgi:putative nucleotidyltransferase with HDIG domain
VNGAAAAPIRLPRKWLGDSRLPALHPGVERLTVLLGEHDPSTLHHSLRVSQLVVAMAAHLGLPARERSAASLAGLLHDVGKSAIPGVLLDKPTPLSQEETGVLRDHAAVGGWMVGPFVPADVAHAVRHHHERLDGHGYPAGLGADDLPWMTRAVAVADTFDALVSHRPYRAGCSTRHAFRELRCVAGTQLDGELIEVLIGVVATPAASLVA